MLPKCKWPPSRAAIWFVASSRGLSVLGRPGSDLLFQALRLSTIGAGEFNGRVRDGIGFLAPRYYHQAGKGRMKKQVEAFSSPSAHADGHWK